MLVILPPLIKYTGNGDSISEDALSKVKMVTVAEVVPLTDPIGAVNNIQSNKSFLIFGNIYRFSCLLIPMLVETFIFTL